MHTSQTEKNWDAVYNSGTKYLAEPPLSFVDNIIEQINLHHLSGQKGLYIGCGNGRNYIPLTNTGLHIIGLDISQIALNEIVEKEPKLAEHLVHSDFLSYKSKHMFDYVIAIQVFQHGRWKEVVKLFKKVETHLNTGGLFCLRVRYVDMPLKNTHQIIEHTPYGGFTAHFTEGQKTNLDIHSFSVEEISFLTHEQFTPVISPHNVTTKKKGSIPTHIEGIWMKNK
jgi:cyclopropane fatty-acyl-phospholipid synthase-like methyltransferase